ncbi:MAG: OmpH family outer membrane protein, partial [candidate division Zixibacteria bacterium]|nr:OmpH family outer membrane protein [candidate division Zixibacteria bacterium]
MNSGRKSYKGSANFARLLTITITVALAFTLFGAVDSSAQSLKIGYVDEEKVIASYEAWAKAEDLFRADYKAWEDEANRMQQAYIEDSVEYARQKLILSSEKKTERLAEINAKRLALESFTRDIFGPNGQAERKSTTLRQPLLDNITAAINKVATDGNYDLVLNTSALAFAIPALDLSDKVI